MEADDDQVEEDAGRAGIGDGHGGCAGRLHARGDRGSGGSDGGSSNAALSVGITATPQNLDPYACVGDATNLEVSAYDTLLRLTPKGTFEPALAESWKVVSPTELSMTLRPGVTFADGTALNAAVVKANLERAASTPTVVTTQFVADKPTITATSDLGLTVSMGHPDPDLQKFLSSCGGMIVHPDLVANPQSMANSMNGTGPYTFDQHSTIPKSKYVFHQRKGYWNAKAYPFATVTFAVVTDQNAGFNALLSGQVDVAAGPLALDKQAESAGMNKINSDVTLYAIKLNDLSGTLVPALADVRVRQALNYAINRKAILQTFFGSEGRDTAQVLNPQSPGYDKQLDDRYAYDAQKAKALLGEAGYAQGFTIQVLTTSVNQFSDFVQAVGSDWGKIGVTLQQVVKPTPEYFANKSTTTYPALFTPIIGFPSYSTLVQQFGPSSPLNPFKATDPELTQALDAAAQGQTAGGDPVALQKAQTVLLDQAWYAAIGYNAVYIYSNPKKVTGVEPQLDQTTPTFYDWKPAG